MVNVVWNYIIISKFNFVSRMSDNKLWAASLDTFEKVPHQVQSKLVHPRKKS